MSELVRVINDDALLTERDIKMAPVLETRHLGIDFGGLKAVDDFNITVGQSEISGLIGPNGAGKTTVFNLLTKVNKPTRGTILLNQKDINDYDTIKANHAGIARTFQNIRLFNNLTVAENVLVGLHKEMTYNLAQSLFRTPAFLRSEKIARKRALELLSIFDMQELADVQAGNLPYGAELMENIRKIRDTFHIAIMLIEHDMNLVMGICEGIAVLNYGRIIAKGSPEEIKNNPAVIEAYLGKQAEN